MTPGHYTQVGEAAVESRMKKISRREVESWSVTSAVSRCAGFLCMNANVPLEQEECPLGLGEFLKRLKWLCAAVLCETHSDCSDVFRLSSLLNHPAHTHTFLALQTANLTLY